MTGLGIPGLHYGFSVSGSGLQPLIKYCTPLPVNGTSTGKMWECERLVSELFRSEFILTPYRFSHWRRHCVRWKKRQNVLKASDLTTCSYTAKFSFCLRGSSGQSACHFAIFWTMRSNIWTISLQDSSIVNLITETERGIALDELDYLLKQTCKGYAGPS
jgi:hypothetical protein